MIKVIGAGRQICRPDKSPTHLIPSSNMIHFVESGHGYFNGHLLSGGDGFICRNDRICTYVPSSDDPWTYSWINIIGDECDALIERLPLENDIFAWNTNSIGILHELRPDSELNCLGVLYRMCADMTAETKEDYVDAAKRIMQCSFANGITVDDVAHELNISRAYLRNVFYAKTSSSPQEYLITLKMKRAESLLSFPYSITEIANACGYSDVMQFSKIFKKHHGTSPSAYREKVLKGSIK